MNVPSHLPGAATFAVTGKASRAIVGVGLTEPMSRSKSPVVSADCVARKHLGCMSTPGMSPPFEIPEELLQRAYRLVRLPSWGSYEEAMGVEIRRKIITARALALRYTPPPTLPEKHPKLAEKPAPAQPSPAPRIRRPLDFKSLAAGERDENDSVL